MELKQLFAADDERAVSPVIGVILMVAITVILAAVIGTFVLGLGDQVQETSPNAQWDWDYDSSNDQLMLTHESGDSVDASTMSLTGDGVDPDISDLTADSNFANSNSFPSEVTAGDSVTINSSTTQESTSGNTVRLIWSGDGSSSTLTSYEF
jgi:flagellin-like protein